MTEPARASDQPDLQQHARELEADAVRFTQHDLHTWYGAVAALEPGQVDRSAELILRRWLELQRGHSALIGAATAADGRAITDAAMHAPAHAGRADQATTAGGPAQAATAPAPAMPSLEAGVGGATRAVDAARRTIGNVVTLQDFRGQPVLGAYRTWPVPADPTPFIDREHARANDVIAIARALAATLSNAQGGDKLSDAQADQVARLVERLPDEMAYRFVLAALRAEGLDRALLQISGHAGAGMRAFHKKLQEQAAVNRDGMDGDVSAELLEQMQTDASELDEAVHKLIVSDEHVNRILGHYKTDRQREVFFKLLERRNLIDAILHRADRKAIESQLHSTTGFERRAYNESLNTSRSLGDQAAYVGDEALRQLPGAMCKFASGVFKGLSKIPVVGPVFGRSSAAFDELTGAADDATGAWNDKTARAWRNGIASTAGQIDAMLLQRGAAAELQAMEVAGVAVTTYEGVKTAVDVKNVADTIRSLVDTVQDARPLVKLLWGSIDLVPQLVSAAVHGDPEAAIGSVSSVLDMLIDQVGGDVTDGWTVEGQHTAAQGAVERMARGDHSEALRDFNGYLHSLEGKPPEAIDQAVMTQKAERLNVAAHEVGQVAEPKSDQVLIPKDRFYYPMKALLLDKLKGALVKLVTALLKTIKQVVVAQLQALIAQRRGQTKAQTTGDWLMGKITATSPKLVELADSLLQTAVTSAVKYGISKLAPDWPSEVVEAGVEGLVETFDEALGGKELIEKPLIKLEHDLARAVLARIPALQLSPEPSA